MSVTIYHNPQCSNSRATLALLEENNAEPVIIEYLNTPPSAGELKNIIRLLGIAPRELLRIKEAKKLGFTSVLIPSESKVSKHSGIQLQEYDSILDLIDKNIKAN